MDWNNFESPEYSVWENPSERAARRNKEKIQDHHRERSAVFSVSSFRSSFFSSKVSVEFTVFSFFYLSLLSY